MRRFCKKNVSLQSETKQNEIRFASNFSLPIKAKLKERIFALFRFQKFSFRFFFVLFSLHFIFVSLQMRKQAKKHFFCIEAKKISLPFRIISLRSENYGSFLLPLRFISLRSENYGSFRFFFVLFSLRSISFRFRFLRFASIRNKRKSTFLASKLKNFASVSLHCASKRK